MSLVRIFLIALIGMGGIDASSAQTPLELSPEFRLCCDPPVSSPSDPPPPAADQLPDPRAARAFVTAKKTEILDFLKELSKKRPKTDHSRSAEKALKTLRWLGGGKELKPEQQERLLRTYQGAADLALASKKQQLYHDTLGVILVMSPKNKSVLKALGAIDKPDGIRLHQRPGSWPYFYFLAGYRPEDGTRFWVRRPLGQAKPGPNGLTEPAEPPEPQTNPKVLKKTVRGLEVQIGFLGPVGVSRYKKFRQLLLYQLERFINENKLTDELKDQGYSLNVRLGLSYRGLVTFYSVKLQHVYACRYHVALKQNGVQVGELLVSSGDLSSGGANQDMAVRNVTGLTTETLINHIRKLRPFSKAKEFSIRKPKAAPKPSDPPKPSETQVITP